MHVRNMLPEMHAIGFPSKISSSSSSQTKELTDIDFLLRGNGGNKE